MAVDFLAKLPYEISLNILSYCNANDLISCCLVCKNWKNITDNEITWKRHCLQRNWKSLSEREIKSNSWKEVFQENVKLKRNWYFSKSQIWDLTEKGKVIHSASLDDFILVLGVGSTLSIEPNSLQVYDVNKNSAKRRQVLNLNENRSFTFLGLANFHCFIAVQFSSLIMVYKCSKRNFCFDHFFHWSHGEFEVIKSLPWNNEVLNGDDYGGGMSTYTFMVIKGDVLYVYIPVEGKLLMWHLVNQNVLHFIPVRIEICELVIHGNDVFIPSEGGIDSFNKGSKINSYPVEGTLRIIMCNRSIVLGGCYDERVSVWDRKSGSLRYTTLMNIPQRSVLHPLRDVIVYTLYSRSNQAHSRWVKAVTLKDGNVLWRTAIHGTHFNVTGHTIHTVCDNFFVLYSPDLNFKDRVAVYNIENGNRIKQFPLDNEIICVSDKFILLGQSKSFDFPVEFYLHLYFL